MSPIPHLPGEIHDTIIDCVALLPHPWPRRALLLCSEVNRAWMSRSRYHTFRSIKLFSQTECDHLEALIRDRNDASSRIAISPYVRSLRVDPPTEESPLIPFSLIRALPSLQELSLKSHLFTQLRGFHMSDFMSPLSTSVTALILPDHAFTNFTDLILLATSFPNLNRLDLIWVTWVKTDFPPVSNNDSWKMVHCLRSLPLTSLKFNAPWGGGTDVFRWLTETSSASSLTKLCVFLDDEKDLAQLPLFLSRCGETLQEFTFASDMPEKLFNHLNFSQLKRLTRITTYRITVQQINRFIALLASLPSPHIRDIRLCLDVWGIADPNHNVLDELEIINWHPLDILLTSSKFSQLTQVIVSFASTWSPWTDGKHDSILRRFLPRLNDRGILRTDGFTIPYEHVQRD